MGMVRLVCSLLPVVMGGRSWAEGQVMERSCCWLVLWRIFKCLALACTRCLPSRLLFRPRVPHVYLRRCIQFQWEMFSSRFRCCFCCCFCSSAFGFAFVFWPMQKICTKNKRFHLRFFFPLEEMQIRISCTFPLELQKNAACILIWKGINIYMRYDIIW